MCPLRLILIFLSATLAGFFVFRSLRSQSHHLHHDDADVTDSPAPTHTSINATSKVGGALNSGFWTLVDMASGRYLWRHLVSSSTSKRST